ncbi:hypothetical protein HK096_006077 [Nowakowskiella sp. JEL0078]|nr:hypothetical protein HK096_006077 [Nowakowskiella sp. JEL0078]
MIVSLPKLGTPVTVFEGEVCVEVLEGEDDDFGLTELTVRDCVTDVVIFEVVVEVVVDADATTTENHPSSTRHPGDDT